MTDYLSRWYGRRMLVDKRRHVRKEVRMNQIFTAEIQIEGKIERCRLYILNISEGGLKISTDLPMPPGARMPIRLLLDEPFETEVEVVWRNDLPGGPSFIGLKFLSLSDGDLEKIHRFMERYTREEEGRVSRLNKVLSVEMLVGGKQERFLPLILELSTSGMKIVHDTPLPTDEELDLRIVVEGPLLPVEARAKVVEQKEGPVTGYVARIQFVAMTEENVRRINKYIALAIAGVACKRIDRTMVSFETWGT